MLISTTHLSFTRKGCDPLPQGLVYVPTLARLCVQSTHTRKKKIKIKDSNVLMFGTKQKSNSVIYIVLCRTQTSYCELYVCRLCSAIFVFIIIERMERSFSFFQRLAIATGGTMHHTDKQHIGSVLNEVLTVCRNDMTQI